MINTLINVSKFYCYYLVLSYPCDFKQLGMNENLTA